jgi:hypothetical protein
MAAPSSTQWEAALNITSSNYDGITSQFGTGDEAYVRSEVQFSAGDTAVTRRPLTVKEIVFENNDSGDILDANGNIADGSVSPDTSTDGPNGSSNTNAQYPFFYDLEDQNNPGPLERWHESQLLTLTGANDVKDSTAWT